MSSWSSMGPVEKAVLEIASEEGLTWEPHALWRRSHQGAESRIEAEPVRLAVATLLHEGLIWMYRVADGNPDLTEAEVDALMRDARAWAYDPNWSHDVALYLTAQGESVYYQ